MSEPFEIINDTPPEQWAKEAAVAISNAFEVNTFPREEAEILIRATAILERKANEHS